jgi:hypothetical protein
MCAGHQYCNQQRDNKKFQPAGLMQQRLRLPDNLFIAVQKPKTFFSRKKLISLFCLD